MAQNRFNRNSPFFLARVYTKHFAMAKEIQNTNVMVSHHSVTAAANNSGWHPAEWIVHSGSDPPLSLHTASNCQGEVRAVVPTACAMLSPRMSAFILMRCALMAPFNILLGLDCLEWKARTGLRYTFRDKSHLITALALYMWFSPFSLSFTRNNNTKVNCLFMGTRKCRDKKETDSERIKSCRMISQVLNNFLKCVNKANQNGKYKYRSQSALIIHIMSFISFWLNCTWCGSVVFGQTLVRFNCSRPRKKLPGVKLECFERKTNKQTKKFLERINGVISTLWEKNHTLIVSVLACVVLLMGWPWVCVAIPTTWWVQNLLQVQYE